MSNALILAHRYAEQGYAVIPVPLGSKAPNINEWPKLRLKSDDVVRVFTATDLNVGVVLGDPSGGLIDIDLDSDASVALARSFLPATGMMFGRESRPASHWIYKVPDPGTRHAFNDPHGESLVEVRGNGHMTLFPGSVHPDGEEVRFDLEREPGEADFHQLVNCARRLAAASLVLPHWKDGQRHDLALAVSGTLLKAGIADNDVHAFIAGLVRASEDDDEPDRHQCVEDTFKKAEDGQLVNGRAELTQIIGEPSAYRLLGWLGSKVPKSDLLRLVERPALPEGFDDPFRETDLANAERFLARNEKRALYSHDLKRWLVWDGTRWAIDRSGQVGRLAAETVKEMRNGARYWDQQAAKWAAQSQSLLRMRNMVALAQDLCPMALENFDADPLKLNCESGIIDLTTGELLQHDPEHYMRKKAPVRFDVNAGCPSFFVFLNRIFAGDQDLIKFLQRAIGYSLTGRCGAANRMRRARQSR